MFEDFDTMDMYGFLDYLEESSSLIDTDLNFSVLEESYGIFEDINGELCVEDSVIYEIMESYDLTEDEAFIVIMEAYENELLAERSLFNSRSTKSKRSQAAAIRDENLKKEQEKEETYQSNITRRDEMLAKAQHENEMIEKEKKANIGHLNSVEKEYQDAERNADKISAANQKRNKKYGAIAGAGGALAVGGTAVLATRAYKAHKAKKEAEARRNRGLRGKLRRLREDEVLEFIDESVDFLMYNFNLSENEALDIVIAENEDLLSERFNPRSTRTKREQAMAQREENKPVEKVQQERKEAAAANATKITGAGQLNQSQIEKAAERIKAQNQADQAEELYNTASTLRKDQRDAHDKNVTTLRNHYSTRATEQEKRNKKAERNSALKGAAGGALAVGAVGGSAYLATRAYKAHKAKKEAEARRNRGLRGKLRRLREDEAFMLEESYGVFLDNGELFIENEMIEYVMDEYNLYAEDAVDVILEACEEDLDEMITEGVKEYVKNKRKQRSHKKLVKAVKRYVNTGDTKKVRPALEKYMKDREND